MFLSLQLVLSRVGGVEMDSQSCIDHSILAIFEDSTVSSEVSVKAHLHSASVVQQMPSSLLSFVGKI